MQKTRVGDVEIVALVDNIIPFEAKNVYPDHADELGAYAAHLDDQARVPMNFGCFLLTDGAEVVLVDTGWGPSANGKLLDELPAAGIAPADIGRVIFTHLHGDHTGWNIDASSGEPTFANATYLVPRGDWEYYRSRAAAPGSFTRDIVPLDKQERMELIEGETPLSGSLTAVPTPGHTPGHTSIAVASGGEYGFILGDVVISTIDAERPELANSFDWAHGVARTTRRRALDQLVEQAALVGASHLPAPGLGRFVRAGDGQRWEGLAT